MILILCVAFFGCSSAALVTSTVRDGIECDGSAQSTSAQVSTGFTHIHQSGNRVAGAQSSTASTITTKTAELDMGSTVRWVVGLASPGLETVAGFVVVTDAGVSFVRVGFTASDQELELNRHNSDDADSIFEQSASEIGSSGSSPFAARLVTSQVCTCAASGSSMTVEETRALHILRATGASDESSLTHSVPACPDAAPGTAAFTFVVYVSTGGDVVLWDGDGETEVGRLRIEALRDARIVTGADG